MIIFFIFGGVIFFGSETAEILEIFTDAEEGRGSYVNRWLRWKCLGFGQWYRYNAATDLSNPIYLSGKICPAKFGFG